MPRFEIELARASDGFTKARQVRQARTAGDAARLFTGTWDVGTKATSGDHVNVFQTGKPPRLFVVSGGGVRPRHKNPPMLVVAMFHPTTLAGVQRVVPALTADEAVHKLFDKFPPRPGHHIEVRRDGRLIGQWFVAKGAHQNPGHRRQREAAWEVTMPTSQGVKPIYRATSERKAKRLAKEWDAGAGGPSAYPWVMAGASVRKMQKNPEMIKPAVSATALANMAMYYVVISGKVPPALSTVVRAPSAMLAALEVSKYDDVHPGDIAAVYSMGYGPGGRGGQLIEKYRVRAIHENPITFHGSYKTGTWYVTGEMPRHTGERARGRQMPVYRVSSKADGLALAKRLRAGGARRVDVYSPSGGGSYHLDRDGRLVES